MARQNRSDVFDPDEVCVMHCINRAVRRAMLCGYDKSTGVSYEHRRDWVKRRLKFLASQYAIDVLSYAIMGNHLHVILRNRPDVVETWSDDEVARRIWNLFPKRKDSDGLPAEPHEHELAMLMASRITVEKYRRRLSDISWLMRQLAEKVARMANAEDQCTGRFWGRIVTRGHPAKSQIQLGNQPRSSWGTNPDPVGEPTQIQLGNQRGNWFEFSAESLCSMYQSVYCVQQEFSMARQNRSDVFDPDEVCVMHCINRAVRRAMLCGYDKSTGVSYEHRRDWVKRRLKFLASQYAIDVLSYAIMGNHLHVILRNRPDVVETWSDDEVARRIWNLFPKRKDSDGHPAEPHEHELAMLMASRITVEKYRRRLSDISWLMRQLAEKVARMANAEDKCTGRFWEGRFKSQPLMDEAAILACSAYVDLNPVRAKLAETPEQSDFTSVQDRIESEQNAARVNKRSKQKGKRRRRPVRKDNWLAPVYLEERSQPGPKASQNPHRASDKGFLPITLKAYLKLVDWTGRQISKGKLGRIPNACKPVLERLGLDRDVWCEVVEKFGRLFRRVVGTQASLKQSTRARRSNGGPVLLSVG